MAASINKKKRLILLDVNENFSNFFKILDSLESESEEELELARVLVESRFKAKKKQLRRRNEPSRKRLKRDERIKGFLEMDNNQFQVQFKISRGSFQMLLELIGPQFSKESKVGRPNMSLKKQLMIVVWLLTHQESFGTLAERFYTSKSCIGMCFQRIVTALVQVSADIVVWPTDDEAQATIDGFASIAGFPNTIGVIDSLHVAIKAPKNDSEDFINSSGFPSIMLQAVCDSELRFTDCFCGYPGGVADSQILENSILYQNILQHKDDYFPNNSHLLSDSSYPLHDWLVTPVHEDDGLTAEKAKLNRMIHATCTISQQTFLLLKRRFCRLRLVDMCRMEMVPKCIVAACVIHNVCLMQKEDISEFLVDGDEDELFGIQGHNSTWTCEQTELGLQKRASLLDQISQVVFH